MRIVVLGAGVQGTLYGVRFARAGHDVTLVARGTRAERLRSRGAQIHNVLTNRSDLVHVSVIERISSETVADLCFVAVRREQLDVALADLAAARGIARCVVMVNHANGSQGLYAALGRERTVLGFPGAAGGMQDGVDRYVEIAEQRTALEAGAPEVAALFRGAGFRIATIRDMDSWLKRHAIFVTAIAGALYAAGGSANGLAADERLMRTFVLAVREGWAALDRCAVAPPPAALRAIFRWVPLSLAIAYWRRLLQSPQGRYYFELHARHAPREMDALAADVRALIGACAASHLRSSFAAIEAAAARAS